MDATWRKRAVDERRRARGKTAIGISQRAAPAGTPRGYRAMRGLAKVHWRFLSEWSLKNASFSMNARLLQRGETNGESVARSCEGAGERGTDVARGSRCHAGDAGQGCLPLLKAPRALRDGQLQFQNSCWQVVARAQARRGASRWFACDEAMGVGRGATISRTALPSVY